MTDHPSSLDDLLLKCSLEKHDSLPRLFAAVAAGAGWEQFLQAALKEGLAGLIYYNGREAAPGAAIPAQVWRDFEGAYIGTLARNTIFLAELDRLGRILSGIDYVVLKGAFLAARVYPSPGVRGFSDIDILLRPSDLAEAGGRLVRAGYRCENTAALRQGENGCLKSVMFGAGEHAVGIDLHWHLLNSTAAAILKPAMDMVEIWNAAGPLPPLPGGNIAPLGLCPEHFLIHLAEHALHHSFDRLILLRDMAELIGRCAADFDWQRLTDDARRFSLARSVYYSLFILRRKTGLAVPDEVLASLGCGETGRAGKLFLNMVMSGRRVPDLCYLAYFAGLSSFRARAGFLLRLALPPRELMASICARPVEDITPGVYLLRWRRLIGYLIRALSGLPAFGVVSCRRMGARSPRKNRTG